MKNLPAILLNVRAIPAIVRAVPVVIVKIVDKVTGFKKIGARWNAGVFLT